MKVIIVGGVAGGATTAARLRRLNEKVEIILIERGKFISFANCGLPYYEGAIHIPLDDLRNRLNELDRYKTYLVYCRTGLRSYIACRILYQNGFKVQNITGGYHFYSYL